MKILNLQQGTQDWHDARAKHFTASEAPAMAGVSKYTSRSALLREKYSGERPEVNAAQQRIFDRGHAAEAAARPMAEEIVGDELFPVTAESDEHPHLLASMDGCTMAEDVIWEHKLWNEELAAAVQAEDLPEHYKVQMDQQLLVSGADKCLFMVSDGTEERCVWGWYVPEQGRFQRLVDGWAQFRDDLAAYQPKPQQAEAQGEAPEALPALHIELSGGVQASNLPYFKARALALIEGIRTELTTDQHFADASEAVKFLKKGEETLKLKKQAALEQTASIAELFDTIDELSETMRQKRLQLDKLVKAEKESRRLEIQQKAVKAFDEWLVGLDTPVPINDTLDVAGAMKGKKTLASLEAAADDEVARAKIEAQQEAHRLADNKALIEKHQGDYAFLFSDWRDLIQRDAELVKLQVENRIAHHKQEVQKEIDAERERIRQEEEAKAQAAQQKKDVERAREAEAARHDAKPIDTSKITAAAKRSAELKPASQVEQPETVTISRKEYETLLDAQAKLDALEAAGVDNWTGYDDAMAQLRAA